LEIISEYLSDEYKISTAKDGVIAWKILESGAVFKLFLPV